MKGKLAKKGTYEIFVTTNNHQILALNEQNWYAIVEGKQGDILVLTDSDHEKNKTVMQGDFFLVHFKNDPEFNDVPHLFLQDEKHYREFILPNGLPTKSDHQKKLIRTDAKLSTDHIEDYLQG